MQARSALFDLYGDHLAERGAAAPVAALVRLLAPVSIAAPAVRTAVSRMVRQGWLRPVRLPAGPGYALTARALRRLDDAAARIYRTGGYSWDGTFDLLVVTAPVPRTARARLSATLSYLGYGALSGTTWAAPRQSWSAYRDAETESLLAELSVPAERFTARHATGTDGAAELVRRAWDLPALAAGYERFVAEYRPLVRRVESAGDEQRYAARFHLVHAWRRFLFTDPQLPDALLPADWPGRAAAEFFDRHAAGLRPAADRYVDACLEM